MNANAGREVVILSGARTPIGKFDGALYQVRAAELGGVAIRAAVERAGVAPGDVDEVLMGMVLQGGAGQAPARQASLLGGIPPSVGATTINKVCGSGMKAAMHGSQAIRAGEADCIVAGGMENMYLAPYALPDGRAGFRLGNKTAVDLAVHDGLWCAFEDHHMGSSAEWVARECGITRPMQDEFALASQQKAVKAIRDGAFKAEITPVEVKDRKGNVTVVDTDEGPRADTSLEALAKLRPAFEKDGTVTAGNAPGITHGGAALVIAGADWAAAKGLKPMARILGYDQGGVEPLRLFLAPVEAVRMLSERTGLSMADYDLVEINEAFAAQVLADGSRIPGWDWNKVNVRGGAVALGHPIGASGARILVTLMYALRDTGGKRGLATACLGGGEAVAMAVEMV
jgi:acetyl-CoA C-acetyltransferase